MLYRNRRKKSFLSKILFGRLSLLIISFLLLLIVALPLINNLKKQYKVNQEIKELEHELVLAEDKNNELKGLIDYLESDNFVEEQARLNLNLRKEGEDVAIIKDVSDDAGGVLSDNITYSQDKINNKNNAQKWLLYFFN
jgi:cell division protein FtsB